MECSATRASIPAEVSSDGFMSEQVLGQVYENPHIIPYLGVGNAHTCYCVSGVLLQGVAGISFTPALNNFTNYHRDTALSHQPLYPSASRGGCLTRILQCVNTTVARGARCVRSLIALTTHRRPRRAPS